MGVIGPSRPRAFNLIRNVILFASFRRPIRGRASDSNRNLSSDFDKLITRYLQELAQTRGIRNKRANIAASFATYMQPTLETSTVT
jgi:hypothetical protein